MLQLQNAKSTNSGFTLIEFCIAVLIMTIGLLALLQSVNVAMKHNLATTIRNEAIAIADEQMVNIKTSVVDTPTLAALVPSTAYITRLSRNSFSNYSVITTIPTPFPSATTRGVNIRVSWRYKDSLYNHSISSLISSPDL